MREVSSGVWAVTAGAFPSNSYICRADEAGGAVLVDVGLDPLPIDEALRTLGLSPLRVFCTHGHFDHLGSASYFQDKYGVPVYLHHADLKTARTNNFVLMAMSIKERITLPELTLIGDDAAFPLGAACLRYRATPGHTPGSCVIEWGMNLFTGDTLFARGVGLSRLPGERPMELRASIHSLWGELDRFVVHPGHGPSASGTAIKRGNALLRAFMAAESDQMGVTQDV